ncbi:hypothetical protein [Plastoroseomonas hellenica]|uniref:hypothetical protein n=1 Tax=Plastoroseomonas hellenica TaxID=2687306 RepID=UPI001BAD8324
MLRFSTFAHIAAAVLYLCSDGAAMVAGTRISVDRGWVARPPSRSSGGSSSYSRPAACGPRGSATPGDPD